MKKIGIVGVPSSYAGADTELHMQILCWLNQGIEIHIVPTHRAPDNEIKEKLQKFGVLYHEIKDYKALRGLDTVSFCNGEFLTDIKQIKQYARTTTFANCMCFTFAKEIEAHRAGMIDLFLYQTQHQRNEIQPKLQKANGNYNQMLFTPYFDKSFFPYVLNRPEDKFRFGRISRDDPGKFGNKQFYIWNKFVSPIEKEGHVLGWNEKIQKKIGDPPEFVHCYPPAGITQKNFYAMCDAVIMTTSGMENLPRVGMEAMASGSLLIVDNRGGWATEIEDGVTGWLCDDENEFIYKASRAAYEHKERMKMVKAAHDKLEDTYGMEVATESWNNVFDNMESIDTTAEKVNVNFEIEEDEKRKIYINYFPMKEKAVPGINKTIIDNKETFEYNEINKIADTEDPYLVAWGYPARKHKFGVMETGFFYNAMHIDTMADYQYSSLNSFEGIRQRLDFTPRESFRDMYLNSEVIKSKYPQPDNSIKWEGVVFAAQNPRDRSVHSCASTMDWYKFYEKCCKYYGKDLLVKQHPWIGMKDKRNIAMKEIADKHGCAIGYYNHSCIDHCEHVVTFNSSFAVDCFLRGVLVKQGAMGQFWQTGAVTFCHGDPSVGCQDTVDLGYQLAEFLGWRYCWNASDNMEDWKKVFRVFAESTELFPLPEDMSYAAHIEKLSKEKK
jgi:glycosyltransferase involved in cell wall biosynthesis